MNGPPGLSYLMEAVSKTFLGSHSAPNYMVSVYTPLDPEETKDVTDLCISWVGPAPGPQRQGSSLCLRLSWCPPGWKDKPPSPETDS